MKETNNQGEYRCWCCGKMYKNIQNNFPQTNHPLFKKYGYYPVCKGCTDKFFDEMTVLLDGSEDEALKYICSMYGLYYNQAPLASSRKINNHTSRIRNYISKIQLNPYTGLSWLDTMMERRKTKADIGNDENDDDIDDETWSDEVTPKIRKFWGEGYSPSVYVTLQGYYTTLLKQCDTKPDIKKQKLMKNLCLMEYQMQVNIQNGKDIGALSNAYKAMLEAAELKVEVSGTDGETFGKWIQEIEKYCPAEYYKDKTKYHDFFGIEDYIERFMYRPLKNLIFGTKEPEKEFWINDENSKTPGE